MPFTLVENSAAFLHVQISGVMSFADMTVMQKEAQKLIAGGLNPRALIELVDFGGWEKSKDWGDITFMVEHGDDIARMAIVGEEHWRDQALMFVASGLRATEIEYFTPDDLGRAKDWIAS